MAEGGEGTSSNSGKSSPNVLECAICLQTAVHPAELPCRHIFCYLCIKGIAFQSGRCAMCRELIPAEFLYKPKLLSPLKNNSLKDTFEWFYEGGTGWWQYDPRASSEIEENYQKGEKTCTLLLAGFLYVIDFNNMVQYRRENPVRKRRIKRDRTATDRLGVAGLPENVLKSGLDDVAQGLQRLWPERDQARTVQPGAENTRFTRQDSENYGLESLGPEDCPGDFNYRAVSPSQRDGRCFNPRLDLGESGDEDSDTEEIVLNEDEPRRLMSGPSNVSPAAFRPMPMRAVETHPLTGAVDLTEEE